MKGDKNYDHTDEFSDIIHTERFISAAELSELFFSTPKWITLLTVSYTHLRAHETAS